MCCNGRAVKLSVPMKKKYTLSHFLQRSVWQTLLVFLFVACSTVKPFYSEQVANWQKIKPASSSKLLYTVFLIGDVGAPTLDKQEPSMKLMRSQMDEAGAQSTTIFLGDNVYHNGLPEPGAYDRELSEARLNEQLNILKGYAGEKYMIPGNHDWNHSGRGGLDAILREQRYVNEYLAEENIVVGGDFFVPGEGCPGPYEVKISDDLVLIAVDSEWWLHPFDRPYGNNSHCGAETEVDFLIQLEDLIEKNQGSDIVVVGHHPLMTRGEHGGFFTVKDHIFPLTMLREWMYLPLPGIGSIYPLTRKYGGILQDLPHPRYQAYIEGLLTIFNKYDNIVYAAGHEHSLQYFKYGKLGHIVSGSGCKISHVEPGGDAAYTQKVKGFSKLLYYDNGEVWTEFWAPIEDGSTGEMTFRTQVYEKKAREAAPVIVDKTNYADSTITIAANTKYKAKSIKQSLLGDHYREEWATPIKVPLLDMRTELGGLTPYQKGGGKQTASLKVRTPEAREYTLRSINKDPTMALPAALRQTFARDLIQDQVSAQHPYGALVVPKLADAAGVYHSNPKLVYIPNTPYLRQYREEFSNTLVILEEDADENHENVASLGNASNLVGTSRLLEKLADDNDNEVDEQEFARARLLDMLIGDWDRHEGQWRWAEKKKEGSGSLYIPVPEDRDQAFFKADGILPWLATRKWAVRNVRNFGYDMEDVVGLNLTALTLDRTFSSSVTRQDWISIAQDIRANMTDAVIEEAVKQLPASVRNISGPEIAAKLKARREQLPEVAEKYYEHISAYVNVAGSDKHERFIVNRLNDQETQVTVYKITKEGELRDTLYKRTFYTNETKELRLYGLDGEDEFEVTGNVRNSPLLRIIGGDGEDRIVDNSNVGGLKKHTVVYDTNTGNELILGSETKNKTSPYSNVNFYDRDNHKIPYIGPRLSTEYNVDDGLFLGAGVLVRTHEFRKSPYAAEHLLEANYAFQSESFSIRYRGDYTGVYNNWNLLTTAVVQGPEMQRNFYGLGNEVNQSGNQDKDFYRVQFERTNLRALFFQNMASFLKVGIGPTYDRFQVKMPGEPNFLLTEALAGRLEPGTFDNEEAAFQAQHYVGLAAIVESEVIAGGTGANPSIGLRWLNNISYNQQLGANDRSFTNLSTEFRYYLSPGLPLQVTWAGRIGVAHNIGDFRFYQANTLGGDENLRGYRRARLAGRTSVFANVDARIQLFDFNMYLAPGRFGLLGLYDVGRVYYDNERKQKFLKSLHDGYGGGVWVDFFNRSVINLTYTVGDFDKLWMLKFGFQF